MEATSTRTLEFVKYRTQGILAPLSVSQELLHSSGEQQRATRQKRHLVFFNLTFIYSYEQSPEELSLKHSNRQHKKRFTSSTMALGAGHL